jgi:hypothetical protein
LPGFSVIVIAQHSDDSMQRLSIWKTVFFTQIIGMRLLRFYLRNVILLGRAELIWLNAITATLGIIWEGLHGALKSSLKARLWLIWQSGCGALWPNQRASSSGKLKWCISLGEHSHKISSPILVNAPGFNLRTLQFGGF